MGSRPRDVTPRARRVNRQPASPGEEEQARADERKRRASTGREPSGLAERAESESRHQRTGDSRVDSLSSTVTNGSPILHASDRDSSMISAAATAISPAGARHRSQCPPAVSETGARGRRATPAIMLTRTTRTDSRYSRPSGRPTRSAIFFAPTADGNRGDTRPRYSRHVTRKHRSRIRTRPSVAEAAHRPTSSSSSTVAKKARRRKTKVLLGADAHHSGCHHDPPRR